MMEITKVAAWFPVSQELLDDAIDLYRALGWPNRCVLGRPCFIHTRYSEACAPWSTAYDVTTTETFTEEDD